MSVPCPGRQAPELIPYPRAVMSPDRPTPPAPTELAPQDVVLRFLESTGRPSEARLYLELFHAHSREQFAALAIDANVMSGAADAVVQDLRFLAALDLYPTVVLGIFQPADAASNARVLGFEMAAEDARVRGRVGGLEDPEDDGRVEVERGEEPEVLDHGVRRPGHDVRVDRERRELLAGVRVEQLEVEPRLGRAARALEKAENDVLRGELGGGRGRRPVGAHDRPRIRNKLRRLSAWARD